MNPDDRAIIDRAMAITEEAAKTASLVDEAHRLYAEAILLAESAKQYYADMQKIISQRTVCFPWLADAIAQYHETADLSIADFLQTKLNPAASAAEQVKKIAAEKRHAIERFHIARFRVKYYESLFPWLEDYVDEDLDELVRQDVDRVTGESDDDPVAQILKALPAAEFSRLSAAERNQRALDLWRRSARKSKWQVGRDYERYIGYLCEEQGFTVAYVGAQMGLEDMGRDLVASSSTATVIIQCKYWAEERTIHEKHVFQLYGTAIEYMLTNRFGQLPTGGSPATLSSSGITARLVTSAKLSERAKDIAKLLGVEYQEYQRYNPDYPVIKCNVSSKTSEKIYHMPFDQQYDNTVVHRSRGEFYASTVREAESRGFRRAWRFRGQF